MTVVWSRIMEPFTTFFAVADSTLDGRAGYPYFRIRITGSLMNELK